MADGCAQDVELTYAIFKRILPYIPPEELRVIDLTIRMFTEPALALDHDRIGIYLADTQATKETLLKELNVTRADLQSSARFAELLVALGVAPPAKPSPSDSTKTIYAFSKTDEGMKALAESDNERVAMLAAARLGQKCKTHWRDAARSG